MEGGILREGVFLVVLLSLSWGPRPLDCQGQTQTCYNGEEVVSPDNSTACVCLPGWTGDQCSRCEGRIRLEESSGVIRDHFGGGVYSPLTECLFYIEADNSVSSIHLRFNAFSTECHWDYLHIYDGDSIFSPKIGAFSGNLIEPPVEEPPEGSAGSSTSGSGVEEEEQEPYQAPLEVTISSTGPQLLMYFYTDGAKEDDGFEISYWLDYSCPSNCSGRGECTDNGTCACHPGWTGLVCRQPVCPGNCSGRGVCSETTAECQCSAGFMGVDCSSLVSAPHWELVTYSILPDSLDPSSVARSGHSVVIWEDYMVIYGGYRFPLGDESEGVGGANDTEELQLFRYHFGSNQLEKMSSLSDKQPQPRYGHTAVVYNDSMYVFGGSKLLHEEITNELWSLDLRTLLWTDHTPSPPDTQVSYNSSDNATAVGVGGDTVVVSVADESTGGSGRNFLPLPVRGHTAHAVGTKMVVLLGLSSGEEPLVPYVQEYDFESGNWTTPGQYGATVLGRTAHSSVYSPDSGLIYVYGGHTRDLVDQLLSYDPISHVWRELAASGSHRYLHSATLVGSALMVTYGGCSVSGDVGRDCLSNDLDVYNIVCDEWVLGSKFTGLPGSGRRYGHSAVLDPTDQSLLVFAGFTGDLHRDMLRLDSGNCSAFSTRAECLNSSVLCVWSTDMDVCVSAADGGTGLTYSCTRDSCGALETCLECNTTEGCRWNQDSYRCAREGEELSPILQCPTELPSSTCDRYSNCDSCVSHQCVWSQVRVGAKPSCISKDSYNASVHTLVNCSAASSCFSLTSCEDCTPGCLWCPSLQQCLPSNSYNYVYVYGQCLGWVNVRNSCPAECSSHQSCSACEETVDCGWCNDPSDTGLGVCMEGGFTRSRNTSQCLDDLWYFDTCAACQCNGHSACVNGSVCESCQNLTTGDHCEQCVDRFWGDPSNGRFCNECDCNGYNPVCNNRNGTCACLDMGVAGDNCRQCNALALYSGDPNNLCVYDMQVGFIYTFGVDQPNEKQGFYATTPRDNEELSFEFEIDRNPLDQTIAVQLFLGRRSQNLWLLVNLTDPIILGGEDSFSRNLDDFRSNRNVTAARLHTFANPSITDSSNFTTILSQVSEDDYTDDMWDGDVTLVVYVYNLTNPMTFKVKLVFEQMTLKQGNLLFLLYFFATFITCFTVLLTAFLSGWYIKRRLDLRRQRRQQYIELQRRVSRGFGRIKLVVNKNPDFEAPQSPTYTAVESCRNNQAAVLTVFVRLPGDNQTGRPVTGRTGLCCGSTLVKVNPKNKSSKRTDKSKARKRGGNSSSLRTAPTTVNT